MNKSLWILRKFMAWGNPIDIRYLSKEGKEIGFWESFGW